MRSSVLPGAALGLLLWGGFVLGMVELATKPWYVVTLMPQCPEDDPLVRVGLFKADILPECLHRDENASTSSRTYFDGLEPQTLPSGKLFLRTPAWEVSGGAIMGRALKLEDELNDDCENFWSQEMAMAMSAQPLNSTIVAAANSSLREKISSFKSDLDSQLEALRSGMMLTFWTFAAHKAEPLLAGYFETIDAALESEASNATQNIAYFVARGADIASSNASEVCADAAAGQKTSCVNAATQTQNLVERMYLRTMAKLMYLRAGIDYKAIDAPARLAAAVNNTVFDLQFIDFLAALSAATVSTTPPLTLTLSAASQDHPLCLAHRAAGILETNEDASSACPLSAVLYSASLGLSTEYASFVSDRVSVGVALFDPNYAGEAQDWCDNPSWWSSSRRRRGLEESERAKTSSSSSSSTSSSTSYDPLDDVAIISRRLFLSTFCYATTYVEARELVETFFVTESCSQNVDLDTCAAQYTGSDTLSTSTVLPAHLDASFAPCRELSESTLAQLVQNENTVGTSEDTPLAQRKAELVSLQNQCTFDTYLSSGELGSTGREALASLVAPCVAEGYFELQACLGLRSALDVAAALYEVSVDTLEDLVAPCASFPGQKLGEDMAFYSSKFFFAAACFACCFAAVVVGLSISRNWGRGLLAACLITALASLLSALGMFLLSLTILNHALYYKNDEYKNNGECFDGELCVHHGTVHFISAASLLFTLMACCMLLCASCKLKSSPSPSRHCDDRSKELHKVFAYADQDEHVDTVQVNAVQVNNVQTTTVQTNTEAETNSSSEVGAPLRHTTSLNVI